MQWFKRLFRSYRNREIIDNLKERISEIESRETEEGMSLRHNIARVANLQDENKILTDQVNGLLQDKESLTKLLKQISKRVARLEVQHTRWFKKMSDDYSAAMMTVSAETSKFSIFATKQIEEKADELSRSVVGSMMENKEFMKLFSDLEFKMNERFALKPPEMKTTEFRGEEYADSITDEFFGITINEKPFSVGHKMATYEDIINWSDYDFSDALSVYYAYADGVAGELKKDGVMGIKEGLEIKVAQN